MAAPLAASAAADTPSAQFHIGNAGIGVEPEPAWAVGGAAAPGVVAAAQLISSRRRSAHSATGGAMALPIWRPAMSCALELQNRQGHRLPRGGRMYPGRNPWMAASC